MTPLPDHTLFQITDPHLRADGELLRYGVETVDPLNATLRVIEESGVRPTALLLTGDLADAGQPGAYRTLRGLVEPLADRIGASVLYAAGNHDRRLELREHLLGRPPSAEPYDHACPARWAAGAGAGQLGARGAAR